MFEETKNEEENAAVIFQRLISNTLHLSLSIKRIYPVYDYFHSVYQKTHYVFYAQVARMQTYASAKDTVSWFTFKQTTKLHFSEQTKQDIVVSQRVILAANRERMHTQYHAPLVPENQALWS